MSKIINLAEKFPQEFKDFDCVYFFDPPLEIKCGSGKYIEIKKDGSAELKNTTKDKIRIGDTVKNKENL